MELNQQARVCCGQQGGGVQRAEDMIALEGCHETHHAAWGAVHEGHQWSTLVPAVVQQSVLHAVLYLVRLGVLLAD